MQQRHQLVSDAVPGGSILRVRFVLTEGLAPQLEGKEDLLPAHIKQRTYDATVSRLHTAKTARSAAADEVQEQRLRLIVLVMRCGNHVRVKCLPRTLQKRIAHFARRLFDGLPMRFCISGHANRLCCQRDFEPRAERLAEPLVAIRVFSADAVVEMRGK
ncbi:hypothetical protein SDC9_98727 [bioreactor metagenome]|uniref:Uncharacterized protein n=1 Tax=bioreactor metagenome TaxID=1076179 RepID=A0A645AQU9_9ZZZZ